MYIPKNKINSSFESIFIKKTKNGFFIKVSDSKIRKSDEYITTDFVFSDKDVGVMLLDLCFSIINNSDIKNKEEILIQDIGHYLLDIQNEIEYKENEENIKTMGVN